MLRVKGVVVYSSVPGITCVFFHFPLKTASFCPVTPSSPPGCPGNSTTVDLMEHRSFPTWEGTSATACLLPSVLQVITAGCCGLSLFTKYLKIPSTSVLPSRESRVTCAVLGGLSVPSVPLTQAPSGQQIHCSPIRSTDSLQPHQVNRFTVAPSGQQIHCSPCS